MEPRIQTNFGGRDFGVFSGIFAIVYSSFVNRFLFGWRSEWHFHFQLDAEPEGGFPESSRAGFSLSEEVRRRINCTGLDSSSRILKSMCHVIEVYGYFRTREKFLRRYNTPSKLNVYERLR